MQRHKFKHNSKRLFDSHCRYLLNNLISKLKCSFPQGILDTTPSWNGGIHRYIKEFCDIYVIKSGLDIIARRSTFFSLWFFLWFCIFCENAHYNTFINIYKLFSFVTMTCMIKTFRQFFSLLFWNFLWFLIFKFECIFGDIVNIAMYIKVCSPPLIF